MFDRSQYTIGWVCAIPPELVAARLHLDAEHDAVDFEALPHDNNNYVFGTIGKHNIVIATLPRGEYGISSAANVARDLIRSFANVRIGLMVGIGGGAPLIERGEKRCQDIRLGDVVVSIPTNGSGGVYQYDYGKAVQEGEFRPTGYLNSPPASLLAAVTALETDFMMNDHDIDRDISDILASRRSRKLGINCGRPNADTDRLYNSTFIHSDETQSCSTICNIGKQIIRRPTRNADETITIHHGLIASANTLMKDALLRNKIARKFGVLCFEMEAAGLMNQLPFLVIRGICDYSDSHKNKGWQGYAAMTAAAYAKKLLLRLAPSKVDTEVKLNELKEIRNDVQAAIREIGRIGVQASQQETANIRSGIEGWLMAADPSTNHSNALQLRHEDTGNWILENCAMRAWREGKFPLIWLHGISGCGKTVLTSMIIKHLRTVKKPQEAVLYFYFDVQDTRKQRLDDALRSLIKQLYATQQSGHGRLERLYEACQQGQSQPSSLQLIDCFEEMCKDQITTIVLDALDECTTSDKLLAWIKGMSRVDQTRFIATSRTEYSILAAFAGWIPCDAMLEIGEDLVDEDIRTVIYHRIHHGTDGLQRWQSNPSIQQEIEQKLMKMAKGMFRWVVCQLDTLKQCLNPKSLRRALRSLPNGLDETYARVLRQVLSICFPDAIRLLQFLVFSEQPLRLEEVVDMLATDPDEKPPFNPCDRMPIPHELMSFCSSLIRITSRQITLLSGMVEVVTEIQLAHPSVREYLRSDQLKREFGDYFQEIQAKSCIVEVSLAYLCGAAQTHFTGIQSTQLPFLKFAARHWIKHAPLAEKQGKSALKWIHKLFTLNDFRTFWHQCYDPDFSYHLGERAHALYYASLGGLTTSAKLLLDEGADINAIGGRHHTALQAASVKGHTGTVKLLLEEGADVNARGDDRHVLRAATSEGHTEIVKLLVENGADVSAETSQPDNALYVASDRGYTGIVKLLLDNGAISEGGRFNTSLYAATSKGHAGILKLLLDKVAPVDLGVTFFGTMLWLACFDGHTETVKVLLANGPKFNVRKWQYDRALSVAVSQHNTGIARLLILKGAGARSVTTTPARRQRRHDNNDDDDDTTATTKRQRRQQRRHDDDDDDFRTRPWAASRDLFAA